MEMKKIVGRDILISCPNLSEDFMIHSDDSKNNLRGIFIQNGNTVAFYSKELTPAQINCKSTER